jgi:hypothetical protein
MKPFFNQDALHCQGAQHTCGAGTARMRHQHVTQLNVVPAGTAVDGVGGPVPPSCSNLPAKLFFHYQMWLCLHALSSNQQHGV